MLSQRFQGILSAVWMNKLNEYDYHEYREGRFLLEKNSASVLMIKYLIVGRVGGVIPMFPFCRQKNFELIIYEQCWPLRMYPFLNTLYLCTNRLCKRLTSKTVANMEANRNKKPDTALSRAVYEINWYILYDVRDPKRSIYPIRVGNK